MNQDQVKVQLLKLKGDVKDFTLIFSGKSSNRVDGLYHPEKQEIILHNRNFKDENELMYTAIHEFAHHLHFTTAPIPISSKAHTVHFWDIFHKLLYRAEELGIYQNLFKTNPEFAELTRKIKEKYLAANGHLMKEFGRLLMQARELCKKHNTSFEDYLDRVLSLPRNTAKSMMKAHVMNLNPDIGFENMKTIAGIKDEETRKEAEEAFMQGMSPEMVKMQFKPRPDSDDPVELLALEKKSIEKRIRVLEEKLIEIDKRMGQYSR